MLSVPGAKIPRKVTIKVARAENLRASMKDGKNKPNNKFKVIILGGKKKESSNTEVATNGNVQWTFTCIVKLHRNQTDPLCILIEDSDGHHKGQVIIPIVKIPTKPYVYSGNQDPATSTNIVCNELEPTNKCSSPSGFLLYWIWVEEYYPEGDGDTGKKSFNKSMSSLFGSKNKLSGSKTNLDKKHSDSISNYSSVSSLNKPEKHKSGGLLKLKIGGKKKHKPTVSDAKITPDSSENDSMSNFSFNMENDNNFNKRNHESSSRHSSFGGIVHPAMGNPKMDLQNHPRDSKSDNHSHGFHDNNLDSNQLSNNIMPIIVGPYSPNEPVNSSVKRGTSPLPNVSNKSNTMNIQDNSHNVDQPFSNEISPFAQNEFTLGHKSKVGSDYSLFTDRENNRAHGDDMEKVKREIAELKIQNNKCNLQINEYQSELESVKQTLCKLRLRLLEDGATKYLEI